MRYLTTIILGLSSLLATAAPQTVLDVSASSMSPTLIMPESYETDTKAMLENWYLKNYTMLDYKPDEREEGDFSEETLLERLQALPTIIEMPLNGPVKNSIQFYARKKQLVQNMLGLGLFYMPIFVEALERHNMPLELRNLPIIESALMPNAVSRAGAAGLWQFMPATGTSLGLEVNSIVDQRRDPYLASDAAARLLKQLYNMYDDWSLAIAAYNCGPGNVNKALRRAGDGKHDFWEIYPYLPAETRGYVPAFIAANYIMTYYKDHGIDPVVAKRPIITDTVHVNRRVHFEQISEVMDIPMEELRALNPQFRKDVIPGDIRPYSLVLPSLQVYAYIANEDSIVNHKAAKYARRGIVEPASVGSGRDSKGEYYDEEIITYHKVRKGETLSKIANKYGVSVASIRKWNKCGKTVKTGRTLKIKTVRRRYKPAPAPEPETVNTVQPIEQVEEPQIQNVPPTELVAPAITEDELMGKPENDDSASDYVAEETTVVAPAESTEPSTAVANAFAASNAPEQSKAKAEKSVPASAPKAKKETPKKATAILHTVRKGDNLSKIARRYGTTVQAIKKANNLTKDQVNVGDKLTIPKK